MPHIRTVLENFIGNKSFTDEQLWSIVSALRGPDEDVINDKVTSDMAKQATTAVIRHKLGFVYDDTHTTDGTKSQMRFLLNPDSQGNLEIRDNLSTAGYFYNHFVSHAKLAFEALGLDWYSVNS